MTIIQQGFADINGAKLYYEVSGKADGQLLVFVHAGVADHRLWDDQAVYFGDRYRIIRYDMRGFGQSEPVAMEFAHRDDLSALLKFLHVEQAHLVGCSMGGGFCMDVTLQDPQVARSLTMVCSGPGGLDLEVDEPALTSRFEQAQAAWQAKDIETVAELETQIWFDGGPRTPDQVDPVKRAKAKAMNLIALTHEAKELGKHKPGLTPPAAERLAELTLPVLVMVGAMDTPYLLAAADYMAERLPNMQKVVMENTAHLPSLEHPDEFNRILDGFLSGLA